MKSWLCLAALFAVLLAPVVTARPARASVRGNSVVITGAGRRHRLRLPEAIKIDLDDASLLSQRTVDGARYLLLFLTGPSRRSRTGMGHCGAGVESGVLWLKLRGWQVEDHHYQQVESCWRGISLEAPRKWVDGIYVVDFWDPTDHGSEFILRYDPAKAAEGFVLDLEP